MKIFGKDNPWVFDIFKWSATLIISIATITTIIISPPNVEFTRQYYEFGLERIIFLVIIFTLLLRLDGFWGKTFSITFTLFLFFLSLIFKWQSADYYSTLGGLLPLRDANAYYQGAQSVIYGFDLADAASYRPIFSSFLAVVMKAVDGNLQTTLIVLVVLNALAVYFAACEIQKSLKSNIAPAIYLILGYMFFRRFSGTLLTENLGFCLGNLALIFLIRGSAKNKLDLVLYGLFLLTIGLNSRAGAFFILPTLALWAGISFRNISGFWRPFFLGLFIIALGMTMNWAIVKLINSPTSKSNANYSYTLYGIASGNKGWEQVLTDYPNASTDEIYALAFQKMKEDPALFLQGVVGAYTDYFVASNGAFSFLVLKSDRKDLANIILWVLSFTGLFVAFVKRQHKIYSIALAFFVGIILSVSLVPPADSTMMRAYAATIPMSCYLIAAGKILPQKKSVENVETHPKDTDWIDLRTPLILSAALLATSLVMPVLIKLTGHPPAINPTVSCDPARQKIAFVIANGSSITLNYEKGSTYVPDIEFFRLAGTIHEQLLTEEEKSLILNLNPGTTITIIQMAIIESDLPVPPINGFLITKGIPQPGIQTLCVNEPQLGKFYFANLADNKIKTPNFLLNPQTHLAIQTLLKAGLWFTFIFILIIFFEINKFPGKKIPVVLLNTAIIACGILLLMHKTGLMPLAWEKSTLDSNKFKHRDNFLYTFDIGNDLISDTKLWDFPAYLYEDNTLLAQPHEVLSIISKYGRGSYALLKQFLFFSTSDNSDPGNNGRQYVLEWPAEVRSRYQIIIFGATLISLLFHFLYLKPYLKQNKK